MFYSPTGTTDPRLISARLVLNMDRIPTSALSSNLVQTDPESVAVEVSVLPGLSQLPSLRGSRLSGGPSGRGRGGVLLITEMFILQNVVGVLPLKISRDRRHDGSVDR